MTARPTLRCPLIRMDARGGDASQDQTRVLRILLEVKSHSKGYYTSFFFSSSFIRARSLLGAAPSLVYKMKKKKTCRRECTLIFKIVIPLIKGAWHIKKVNFLFGILTAQFLSFFFHRLTTLRAIEKILDYSLIS